MWKRTRSTTTRNDGSYDEPVLVEDKPGGNGVIGIGAVVKAKMRVPAHSLVVGVPAKVVRATKPEDERWTVGAAAHYVELGAWYRDNLKETT